MMEGDVCQHTKWGGGAVLCPSHKPLVRQVELGNVIIIKVKELSCVLSPGTGVGPEIVWPTPGTLNLGP